MLLQRISCISMYIPNLNRGFISIHFHFIYYLLPSVINKILNELENLCVYGDYIYGWC